LRSFRERAFGSAYSEVEGNLLIVVVGLRVEAGLLVGIELECQCRGCHLGRKSGQQAERKEWQLHLGRMWAAITFRGSITFTITMAARNTSQSAATV